MSGLSRAFRKLGLLAIVLFAVWAGGLAWFVLGSVLVTVDRVSPTDAIVVLTGGRQRLETGLALLAERKAARLFVSGVNPRVDLDTLLRMRAHGSEREACCIELGHAADSTHGNARETAIWMREGGYRSLRLVTSWYHMRRSLLEFSYAMPRLTIVAHPVFAPHSEPENWRELGSAAQLLVGEYHKYLAAWARHLVFPQPQPRAAVIRTTAAPCAALAACRGCA